MPLAEGTLLGRYRIGRPLGAGGMGVVYRAVDERLGRSVAVKVMTDALARDPDHHERFEREARAIAALNHPHVCAIHDIGQHDGVAFIVMELLEGEPLSARLARGPVPRAEALSLGLTMLDTLGALHARGFLHRDLKPANIFLATHGLKLLDFGLARRTHGDLAITQPGVILGSPRYMAPEQLCGGAADPRSDLFAAAAVIYESIAGRPAFDGGSIVEVAHAVLHGDPPPLPSGVAPALLEQVLRRALAKAPSDRFDSVSAFASALRAAGGATDATAGFEPVTTHLGAARAIIRLVVLPFRQLRADPETEFLGFGLADAVATALASLDSIVVRSTHAAALAPGAGLDPKALAERAAVDAVVTGTLLRAGSEVRVTAQLLELPHGSVAWSHAMQAPVQDLFQLQDSLTHAIVSSLHVPLTEREHRALRRDVPASAPAYELYLRGNQLMADSSRWADVRALYEQAVALDPGYAPAWARLGRVLRVLAKYGTSGTAETKARAERAFERALALNPDLAMAHHLYAHLEAEVGRAGEAMVRLLTRARAWRADPDLFVGLTTVCRYVGLLDESLAAFERARALDPAVRSSVAYTHLMRREFARAIETDTGSPPYAATAARCRMGGEEARAGIEQCLEIERSAQGGLGMVAATYRLAMTGPADELLAAIRRMPEASGFTDPEGFFLRALFVAHAGLHDDALELLEQAVSGGYFCPSSMREDPYLDGVRHTPRFARLLGLAEAGTARARDAFVRAGGPSVLGGR
jgi:TolB-like protein